MDAARLRQENLPFLFGAEWHQLDRQGQEDIIRDIIRAAYDDSGFNLIEYQRSIGSGNLRAYAKTQRIRFEREGITDRSKRETVAYYLSAIIECEKPDAAKRVLQDMKTCLLENSQRHDTVSALYQWLERAVIREFGEGPY